MSARSYEQYCGLAAALDVLGERWTMLVLRELALGPKRYRDLIDALPGIGTNLLATRLKTLEEAGVLRKATLPPPAGVQVYELTARGEQLRPALEGLALWGLQLLPDEVGERKMRPAWAASCMRAGAPVDAAQRLRGDAFAFDVAGEEFHIAADGDEIVVRDGPPPVAPIVRVTSDLPTYLALATRAITPAVAASTARLEVEGDVEALERLLADVHLPARGRRT
ncbi:MAG: transcriptional regulator [Solirubrobacteraceae bacterium]|nr:transcriptional regulator [Solirubrobacteraceae bacterium]